MYCTVLCVQLAEEGPWAVVVAGDEVEEGEEGEHSPFECVLHLYNWVRSPNKESRITNVALHMDLNVDDWRKGSLPSPGEYATRVTLYCTFISHCFCCNCLSMIYTPGMAVLQ